MIFNHKAVADDGIARQGERAHVQIENVLAAATLEMFVVSALDRFKTRLARRQNHALDLFAFLQQLERAINGGKANSGVFAFGALVDFGNGQRPVGFGDNTQNRVALARLANSKRWRRTGLRHKKVVN